MRRTPQYRFTHLRGSSSVPTACSAFSRPLDRMEQSSVSEIESSFGSLASTVKRAPNRAAFSEKEEHSRDYYGVLRGASAVGVPGMIVEHAHHTVAETRQYAMTGPLAELWADADAKGIAAAYDFVRAAS